MLLLLILIFVSPPIFTCFDDKIQLNQGRSRPSFDITFHCDNTTFCDKARRVFDRTSDMISSLILFKEPVKVNVTLVSFCQLYQQCDKKHITLGGSCPSRSIPLLSKDGRFRLYPQALMKQFELEERPLLAPFDIISVFNSDAPFWFEEDQIPISSSQADFTFVILHEFMHGLGFYSGWNQYLNSQLVTPDPSPFLTDEFIHTLQPNSNAIHPTQFIESAMDRLIYVLPYQIPLSQLTSQINSEHTLSKLTSFNKLLTKPLTLAIKLNDTNLILETGLSPFRPGSSLSHLAFQKYTNHPEFLMRYKQERGMTLTDVMNKSKTTHPIGPLLLSVMEELGYPTVNNPTVTPPLLLSQNNIVRLEEERYASKANVNSIAVIHFISFILLFY